MFGQTLCLRLAFEEPHPSGRFLFALILWIAWSKGGVVGLGGRFGSSTSNVGPGRDFFSRGVPACLSCRIKSQTAAPPMAINPRPFQTMPSDGLKISTRPSQMPMKASAKRTRLMKPRTTVRIGRNSHESRPHPFSENQAELIGRIVADITSTRND